MPGELGDAHPRVRPGRDSDHPLFPDDPRLAAQLGPARGRSSSREEPFGRIPLEAFAAGAGPVVATMAGGLAQTVVEGETGFTAMPRDARSLAAALHRALTVLPRERDRLRSAGAALVRSRHDYEASIGSVVERIAPWALVPTSSAVGRVR
ncbi:glycosyltransferase [Streptomyces zhihengii]